MPNPNPFEPPHGFTDPRVEPGFEPRHWPLRDGNDAPAVGSPELHDRRCAEFLAAYYRINRTNERLRAARESGDDAAIMRSAEAAVGEALAALEALEDRYAPVGFYGEPTMDGERCRDVAFVRPGLPRLYPEPVAMSSHVAIPGLEGIPASELQGPVVTRRWRHGKVDL